MRILNDQNYSKEESKTYKMPENFEATISIHVNFTMKRAVRIILLSPKATPSSQMQDKTNSTLGDCAARIKVSKRLQVARNSFDWTTMALEAIGFPAGIGPAKRDRMQISWPSNSTRSDGRGFSGKSAIAAHSQSSHGDQLNGELCVPGPLQHRASSATRKPDSPSSMQFTREFPATDISFSSSFTETFIF